MFEIFICLKLDALPWRFCFFEDNIKFFKDNLQTVTAWNIVRKLVKINTARQIQAFEYDKEKKVLQKIINQN